MEKTETRDGPIPLTEAQLSAVAGGTLTLTVPVVRGSFPGKPTGCQACTSGGPIDVLGAIGAVVQY